MEHSSFSDNGESVHYWTAGQGSECVVFTHGATMDHKLFQLQFSYFAEKFKVIVWDVPSHGLSRPYQGFSLQRAAQALLKILDLENVDTAHLVGQSMGGYISQIVAREQPERVSSIITVGSSPLHPHYYSTLDLWLLSITPPLIKLYPYGGLVRAIAAQTANEGESYDYALTTLSSYSKSEIAAIMDGVYKGVKTFSREEKLPVPILITFGENDRTGKVQAYCHDWAKKEQRPLKVIPAASHNANMDNPDQFNQMAQEFIQQVIKNQTVS